MNALEKFGIGAKYENSLSIGGKNGAI